MRTFEKELTEYFEFQLEDDEKVYRIPLAAAMPFSLLDRMSKAADTEDRFTAQVDMLRKYMGDVSGGHGRQIHRTGGYAAQVYGRRRG